MAQGASWQLERQPWRGEVPPSAERSGRGQKLPKNASIVWRPATLRKLAPRACHIARVYYGVGRVVLYGVGRVATCLAWRGQAMPGLPGYSRTTRNGQRSHL